MKNREGKVVHLVERVRPPFVTSDEVETIQQNVKRLLEMHDKGVDPANREEWMQSAAGWMMLMSIAVDVLEATGGTRNS